MALDVNGLAPIVALHRGVERKTHLADAGNCCQRIVKLPKKRLHLSRFVSRHLRIDVHDVPVRCLESEFLGLHVVKALRQQPGCRKQHERKRSLRDDQRVLRPAAATSCGAACTAQRIGRSGVGRDPSRSNAEKDSCDKRYDECESEHGQGWRSVNRDVRVLKREVQNYAGRAECDSHADHTSEQRQHDALVKHLPNLAPGRRTERRSDRGLKFPRTSSDEHQVCHVRAGDC